MPRSSSASASWPFPRRGRTCGSAPILRATSRRRVSTTPGAASTCYHPDWRAERDRAKHDRVLELAEALPKLRRRVARDLAADGLGRDRVLACAVRLLELGLFRVGGEAYAEDNGSYGLATLRKGHVRAHGDELRFDYPGKSGQRRVVGDRRRTGRRGRAGPEAPPARRPRAAGVQGRAGPVDRRALVRHQRVPAGRARPGVHGQGLPHLDGHGARRRRPRRRGARTTSTERQRRAAVVRVVKRRRPPARQHPGGGARLVRRPAGDRAVRGAGARSATPSPTQRVESVADVRLGGEEDEPRRPAATSSSACPGLLREIEHAVVDLIESVRPGVGPGRGPASRPVACPGGPLHLAPARPGRLRRQARLRPHARAVGARPPRTADGQPGGMFVVQRHRARRLHYDLRLEVGRRAGELGGAQGPDARPGRPQPGRAGRGPPDGVRRLRGRDPRPASTAAAT